MSAIPIIVKPYLSYIEIGYLYFGILPFSLKVFWSPIVEKYHVKAFGKRKTWIIPS